MQLLSGNREGSQRMRLAALPGILQASRFGIARVIRHGAYLVPVFVTAAALAAAPAVASAPWPMGAPSAATGRYVALGDSYTAGPLIPNLAGSPAGCARSSHDFPSLVAAAIGASQFKDVSCQGADTTDMAYPESVPLGVNPPQFSALNSGTSLVTVQIGGNDINFIDIVINCTARSFLNPFGSPCKGSYTSGGTDQLAKAVAQAGPRVAAVLRGIHKRAPNARVLLVGYPVILPASGHGCWPAVPVAHGDVPYLRGIEIKLNDMLAAEAAGNGATYVDTYTASIGHDVCQAPGAKWVEGLVPTSPAAPFHPNARGEKGMAKQVIAAVG
jgi:lysophospholipase L1-like esterase